MRKEHPTSLEFTTGEYSTADDPDIFNIIVDPHELARALSDLRYDSLSAYLAVFAEDIQFDSEKDYLRDRPELARKLGLASRALYDAAFQIGLAWKICEPYMKVSNTNVTLKDSLKSAVAEDNSDKE